MHLQQLRLAARRDRKRPAVFGVVSDIGGNAVGRHFATPDASDTDWWGPRKKNPCRFFDRRWINIWKVTCWRMASSFLMAVIITVLTSNDATQPRCPKVDDKPNHWNFWKTWKFLNEQNGVMGGGLKNRHPSHHSRYFMVKKWGFPKMVVPNNYWFSY